jgi:hypothetical protein
MKPAPITRTVLTRLTPQLDQLVECRAHMLGGQVGVGRVPRSA